MSLINDPGAPPAPTNAPAPGAQPPAPGQSVVSSPATYTDWRSALPADLQSAKPFESIKGKDWSEAGPVLAKNYLNAQALIGAKGIIQPTDKSTPQEWSDFYKALGRPEKPEEYTPKLPDSVKEEMLDKGRLEAWRKELHEAGLTKAQAERVMSKQIGEEFSKLSSMKQAQEKQSQDWVNGLRTELGDKFDATCNHARFAAKEFGSPELVAELDRTGLGDHPAVVKFLAKIGQSMSDDRARTGGGRPVDTTTAEGAQQVIKQFESANWKVLADRQHPDHNAAVEQRMKLYLTAFPTAPEKT